MDKEKLRQNTVNKNQPNKNRHLEMQTWLKMSMKKTCFTEYDYLKH